MAKPRNEWRHLLLLASILLLFVITPLVEEFRHGVLIMNAVAAVVLLAGSYTLSERKRLFAVAVVLSGISIMATWILLITQQPWAAVLSHSCVIVLITFFSVTILDYVLRGTRITLDKIFAAVCVYLLIGYAWTFAYALTDELQPGSFVFLTTAPLDSYVARVLEMRYLSFMTLTTVGYGDVVPHSDAARTLAALEAVAGQIYLTVLIARLVGLHIVHAHTTSSQKD
jgi:voltage-gated potassium channel